MKKNLFMVAAVALIATVSCNKEEFRNIDAQGVASDVVFVAELEQPGDDVEVAAPAAAQTKTALGSTTNGVTAVNWVGNEKVSINGVEFTTTSTGAKATFTTTKTFDKTAAKFDAIYPASAGTALTAVTIPASQKGTFAEAAISVATSTTTSLNFKNLASIIKFQVPSACSTITITSTANLAGKVPVTFGSNGLPTIGTVSSASKTITLTGSFTTGKDYYVAVLPGSHKFTVRLDGYLSKASTTAVTTKRAVITNLKTLPALTASSVKFKVGTTEHKMYKEGNYEVVKNVSITESSSYNVIATGSKSLRGVAEKTPTDTWVNLHQATGNMKGVSGTFDVYVDTANGKFCIVNTGANTPSTTTYYFMYQNTDWQGLYAWSGSNYLLGAWDQCGTNRLGTFTTPGGKTCSYWAIPAAYSGKTFTLIVRNAGYSIQSHDTSVSMSSDTEAWESSWTDGKAKLGTYAMTPFKSF